MLFSISAIKRRNVVSSKLCGPSYCDENFVFSISPSIEIGVEEGACDRDWVTIVTIRGKSIEKAV